MRRHWPSVVAAALASAPALAQQSGPPLFRQINNGNWLPPNEAEQLRDDLFYQRAIHAYVTMIPALNTIGMRDGSAAAFGKGYNTSSGRAYRCHSETASALPPFPRPIAIGCASA